MDAKTLARLYADGDIPVVNISIEDARVYFMYDKPLPQEFDDELDKAQGDIHAGQEKECFILLRITEAGADEG